eukprot:10771252-Alexandrium_andersonii.AAC.1
MSASLVGSEMCIRDSPPPPPALTDRAPSFNCLPISASGTWEALERGPWTVSYTHLTLPTICSV